MNKKILLFALILIVCLLAAAFVVSQTLSSKNNPQPEPVQTKIRSQEQKPAGNSQGSIDLVPPPFLGE